MAVTDIVCPNVLDAPIRDRQIRIWAEIADGPRAAHDDAIVTARCTDSLDLCNRLCTGAPMPDGGTDGGTDAGP
jgi:hypothetical protein